MKPLCILYWVFKNEICLFYLWNFNCSVDEFFNSNFQANALILKCYADFQNVVLILEYYTNF